MVAVVYEGEFGGGEAFGFRAEVAELGAFSEGFDGGEDGVFVAGALVHYCVLGYSGKLLEGDDHEFLEAGDGAELLVVGARVGGFVEAGEVRFEDGDEGAVVGCVEELFTVDAEDGEADLEEDFGALEEEDVEDAEGEDEGHGVDVEGEEPRERDDGELDVGFDEVLPEDRHGLLNKRLEDALVEEGAVHGFGVVAGDEAVAERREEEEGLGFGHVAGRVSGVNDWGWGVTLGGPR